MGKSVLERGNGMCKGPRREKACHVMVGLEGTRERQAGAQAPSSHGRCFCLYWFLFVWIWCFWPHPMACGIFRSLARD